MPQDACIVLDLDLDRGTLAHVDPPVSALYHILARAMTLSVQSPSFQDSSRSFLRRSGRDGPRRLSGRHGDGESEDRERPAGAREVRGEMGPRALQAEDGAAQEVEGDRAAVGGDIVGALRPAGNEGGVAEGAGFAKGAGPGAPPRLHLKAPPLSQGVE